ncbi:nicalin-1-like [Pyrus ussuriensis x Pyrus communis]|uniref:Nicalin-1-like n=1 Tax=Pyrus ussuriensis x Pyrus communis TaxID=2448454 RepID=A0A5N5FY70_9ROSA|nr:nicalin-1-like [Pyrus ussuriensis x Pyrus communis]
MAASIRIGLLGCSLASPSSFAAIVVDMYRLIQYNISDAPFGSRLTNLNHHAGSLNFAPGPNLSSPPRQVRVGSFETKGSSSKEKVSQDTLKFLLLFMRALELLRSTSSATTLPLQARRLTPPEVRHSGHYDRNQRRASVNAIKRLANPRHSGHHDRNQGRASVTAVKRLADRESPP